MTEDEYLDLVERIQKAMMIEPFRPDVADVVTLIGNWQTHAREIERLRAVAESSQSVLACLRGSAHRNDGAPIVDVCRVLLNTTQVDSLVRALEALGRDRAS
jgi:hypothetical protein